MNVIDLMKFIYGKTKYVKKFWIIVNQKIYLLDFYIGIGRRYDRNTK